jgi:hypothetical protein
LQNRKEDPNSGERERIEGEVWGKGENEKKNSHTSNIVNAVVHNDVHALLVLVLGDLGLGDLLGHFVTVCRRAKTERMGCLETIQVRCKGSRAC